MQCECGNPEMKFLYTEPGRFHCFWCDQCGRLGRNAITALKFNLVFDNDIGYEEHELLKKKLPPDVVDEAKPKGKIGRSLKTRTTELVRQLKESFDKKTGDEGTIAETKDQETKPKKKKKEYRWKSH